MTKIKTYLNYIFLFLGSFFFSSFFLINNFVLAEDNILDNSFSESKSQEYVNSSEQDILGSSDSFLTNIAKFLLNLTVVLGVSMLIIAGIYFLLSLWDESKAKKATKAIVYIILWIVLALSSVAIIYLIKSITTNTSLLLTFSLL